MLYGNKEVTFNPRLLPERSYLYYKYPQLSSDRSLEFYFPIMENLEISESQRPSLGVYDLLGRPGSLFSYHGSKSREFSLRFFITLPNVVDYLANIGLNKQFSDSFRYFYNERDFEKRKFFIRNPENAYFGRNSDKLQSENPNFSIYYQNSLSDYNSKLKDLATPSSELDNLLRELSELTNSFKIPVFENPAQILNFFKLFPKQRPPQIKNAVNYFMLLVNVIRTSTVNNSENTSLSPPTIYINHGTMYNNIPCVCTNYNLRIVSENGYELKNMNPRRVEVTMSLSENRTGNFGSFKPWSVVQGNVQDAENLAGWEAVINQRTMDPWNSTFGEYDSDLVALAAYEKKLEEEFSEAKSREGAVNETAARIPEVQVEGELPAEEGLGNLVNPYAVDRNNDYNISKQTNLADVANDSVAATVKEQRAILETQGYEGLTREQLEEMGRSAPLSTEARDQFRFDLNNPPPESVIPSNNLKSQTDFILDTPGRQQVIKPFIGPLPETVQTYNGPYDSRNNPALQQPRGLEIATREY